MKKTVFFDLGNVLIFFSHEKMFRQLANCANISLPVLKNYAASALESYETGRLTTEEIHSNLSSLAPKGHVFSLAQTKSAISDIFITNLELWPLVEELKTGGAKLVLISNTNECHYDYIAANYPILQLFDRKILSYEVGASKPHPKIFEHALNEAEGSSFYTDDIPAFIEAGRKAGLDAELFTDVPSLRRHLSERNFISFEQ